MLFVPNGWSVSDHFAPALHHTWDLSTAFTPLLSHRSPLRQRARDRLRRAIHKWLLINANAFLPFLALPELCDCGTQCVTHTQSRWTHVLMDGLAHTYPIETSRLSNVGLNQWSDVINVVFIVKLINGLRLWYIVSDAKGSLEEPTRLERQLVLWYSVRPAVGLIYHRQSQDPVRRLR